MKKFKKIMAILVAALMIVAMAVPAMSVPTLAAAAEYSITIQYPLDGETYTAFKIFDAPQSIDTTADVYVQVPVADIVLDSNKDITYYTKESTTYDAITTDKAGRQALVDANKVVYEKTSKNVAYTIKGGSGADKNPWYDFVDGYQDTAGKGITLTPTAGDPDLYIVEITAGTFSAADFAKELKKHYDGLSDANKGAYKAATSGSTSASDADGTYDGSNTVTLNVGKVGTPAEATNDLYRGPGYYFVDTTTGSLCALNTTTPTATIREKNSAPTETKEVWKTTGATPAWPANPSDISDDDAQIGDTVTFKITVKDGMGTDTAITVYDMMSAGLSFNSDSIKVFKKVKTNKVEDAESYYLLTGKTPEKETAANYDAGKVYYTDLGVASPSTWQLKTSDYGTVKDNKGDNVAAANIDFAVVLVADYVKNSLDTNDEIVIYYTANVTYAAEMANTANTNETFLNYANQNTVKKTTNVYSYEIDLVKYDKDSPNKMLKDAKFKLYRADQVVDGKATGTALTFYAKDGVYRIKNGSLPEGYTQTDTITSLDTKAVKIQGLDVDKYYLVETTAPDGYIPLKAPVEIEVTRRTTDDANKGKADVEYVEGDVQNDGTITYTGATTGPQYAGATVNTGSKTYTSGGTAIANTAGKELPSTGGMGTTVLYIVGGMLVILAGAYLFFSRRRTA